MEYKQLVPTNLEIWHDYKPLHRGNWVDISVLNNIYITSAHDRDRYELIIEYWDSIEAARERAKFYSNMWSTCFVTPEGASQWATK